MTKGNETSIQGPCDEKTACISGDKIIAIKETTPRSPLKAIREKCIDCCGGSKKEVRLCWATKCPTYPFRMGSNPYRKKRTLTEAQKQERLERLKQ